jgi:TolB protein
VRKFLVNFSLIMTFLTGVAQAELDIVITEGIKRRPIAVVPFGWEGTGGMPLDVAQVIGDDLTRSGRFAPIPEDDMLQKPTSGVEMDFDDWSILGVEAVVIGRITQTGENAYSVEFRLFDVFGRDQLVGYRMPASRGTMRRAAHRAADMIYEKLTGIKGVFDTKVAYVTAEQRSGDRLYSLMVSDQDGEMCLLKATAHPSSSRRSDRATAFRSPAVRGSTVHRRFRPTVANWS